MGQRGYFVQFSAAFNRASQRNRAIPGNDLDILCVHLKTFLHDRLSNRLGNVQVGFCI